MTKKDVVVLLGGAAVVKKFPQEQAEQMARMQMMEWAAARVRCPTRGRGKSAGGPTGSAGSTRRTPDDRRRVRAVRAVALTICSTGSRILQLPT